MPLCNDQAERRSSCPYSCRAVRARGCGRCRARAFPTAALAAGERTLLQETALRVADRLAFIRPTVIANAEHRFAIAEQLRESAMIGPTIVLEPFGGTPLRRLRLRR